MAKSIKRTARTKADARKRKKKPAVSKRDRGIPTAPGAYWKLSDDEKRRAIDYELDAIEKGESAWLTPAMHREAHQFVKDIETDREALNDWRFTAENIGKQLYLSIESMVQLLKDDPDGPFAKVMDAQQAGELLSRIDDFRTQILNLEIGGGKFVIHDFTKSRLDRLRRKGTGT